MPLDTVAAGAQRVRLHGQRRRARGRRRRGRARCSTRAASSIPISSLKVVLPGVGARRRASACSSATASRRCSCRSPVGEPDARVRLDAVRATTADLKEREQAVGAAALLGLSEYAAPTLLGPRGPRRARAARSRNLIVTNMPGPQVPLYCLGARDVRGVPDRPARHGTSPSTSRSCRTAGSCTSGSSATAQSGRDLETARRRHRGRVRRARRARRRCSTGASQTAGRRVACREPMPRIRTAEVTDLLQQLIRNQCVNDGTVASGEETRSVDLLAGYLAGAGRPRDLRAAAGPPEPRRAHRGHRPRRADAAADGPHRRRAGEPRRLEPRSVRRRARRRLRVGPRRGRHAQPHRVAGGRVPPPRRQRVPAARAR